jgi:hypothetical protein
MRERDVRTAVLAQLREQYQSDRMTRNFNRDGAPGPYTVVGLCFL